MRTITFILFFTSLKNSFSQVNANAFTWIKGSSIQNQASYYGGPDNILNTPGAAGNSMNWVVNNKLYLFGGSGGRLLDGGPRNIGLWEYNTDTNLWNLIKDTSYYSVNGNYGTQGVSNSTNTPPLRFDACTWLANGKLYLFGGYNSNGLFSDLWEFDFLTNNWTWIKGSNSTYTYGVYGIKGLPSSTNLPGARKNSQTWEYNGNLYLFGGNGLGISGWTVYLSDFWIFNTSTNNWTWIGGNNSFPNVGIYGTQGIGSIFNLPGGRYRSSCSQLNNKFYLFGGYGFSENSEGFLNDLWEFDAITSEWKFLKGDKTSNNNGIYNNQGEYNSTTKPGARTYSSLMTYNNKLYLFGGSGYGSNSFLWALNDLFIYNIGTSDWAWRRGDNTTSNFGMKGVPSHLNMPKPRSLQNSWVCNNKLYIFGGFDQNFMDDLWSYIPFCNDKFEFYSVKSGNWDDPTVWSCGIVPSITTGLTIKDHIINLNGNFGISSIDIENGSLIIPSDKTLTFYLNSN